MNIDGLVIGTIDVAAISVARNLGTWFDFNLNLQEQIHITCFLRFFGLLAVNSLQNAAANVPTVT